MYKKSYSLISFVLLLVVVSSGSAATYYVDFDGGSDFNSGLSVLEPFKHCPGDDNAAGVPEVIPLSPGDSVLFKAGVNYRGTVMCNWSGGEGNPITYGTYGTGYAIIDGSESITGWTQCQSAEECGGNPNWQNIYTSTVPPGTDVFIANMYEDNRMLWPSQDPDLDDPFFYDDLATFRPIHSDNVTRTSLTDPSYFTQPDPNYWNGAFLLLWGNPNIVRALRITSYVPAENKVQFDDTGESSLYDDRTVYYAVANHLLKLNVPGEYVVDDQTDTIYLWPRSAGSISQKQITVSRRRVGIDINGCDYITIDGLKIQKHTAGLGEWHCGTAVLDRFGGSHNVVRNNIIAMNRSMEGQGVIRMYGGCSDITIEDNYVYENPKNRGMILTFNDSVCRGNIMRKNGGTSIDFYGCINSQMTGNLVIEHTGVHANGLTLYLSCNNCLVAYNTVYDGSCALTIQNSTDITSAYNVLHTARDTYTATDWGGCDGLYYYNNVILNSYAKALNKGSSTTNVVARNNILDGAGVGYGSNISHNIYTDLSWSQAPAYGWSLGEGEMIEEDKTNIFIDPANRNFHILSEGPAINAGTDLGFARDIEGTSVPQGPAPDIGAYEYAAAAAGDFNGDGVVDFKDVKIMADEWLATEYILTGMVSRYKFDGDANDSVNGNHGIEVGDPCYAPGMHGQAISLDGSVDYVDCGNDSSFDINDSITLSAWIKGTFNNNWDPIIAKGLDWQLTKGMGDEAVFFCLGIGYVTGLANINDNEWHHVAGVYDGSKLYLYVDGGVDASKSASGSLNVSASDVYIGGSPSASFNGFVDDVRIYDRALSADEVEALYYGPEFDLVSDCNIDFKDFAVLAGNWHAATSYIGTIPPVADAGTDRNITDVDSNGFEMVTLNGSASYDPDGTIESYVWKENNTEIATGVCPDVALDVNEHTITLIVTDNVGAVGSDDVVITVNAETDTTPPEPDPMTWLSEPNATGTTSISMTATTATDDSGVQYYFECTAGGGHSSGWQGGSTYEDTGLEQSTTYSYKAKAPNDYYTITAVDINDPNIEYWQLKVDVQAGGIFSFKDLTDAGDGMGDHNDYLDTEAYNRKATLLEMDGRGCHLLTRNVAPIDVADKMTFVEGPNGFSFTIRYEETISSSEFYHNSYADGDLTLNPGDLLTTVELVIKPPTENGTFWDWTASYENVSDHDLSAKIWAEDSVELWLWDDVNKTSSSEVSMIDGDWNPANPKSYICWTIDSNPLMGLIQGREFIFDRQTGLAGHEAGGTITVGDWAGFDYLKYKAGFDYGAADALPSGSTRTDTGQVIIDIAAQEP